MVLCAVLWGEDRRMVTLREGALSACLSISVDLFIDLSVRFIGLFQAVEELLESLDLENSSYHMGLSRVSNTYTDRPTDRPTDRQTDMLCKSVMTTGDTMTIGVKAWYSLNQALGVLSLPGRDSCLPSMPFSLES